MSSKKKSGKTGRKEKANSRETIPRLFLWLDKNLENLEERQLDGGAERSPTDNEKDARTMISLVRVYEKLVELTDRQADQKENVQSDEAERICIELAERIERLQQGREDQASSDLEQKSASDPAT